MTRQVKDKVEVTNEGIKITTVLIVPNPPESTTESQTDTCTISIGTTGNIYSISIDSDGTTEYVDTIQMAGDTVETIAERLLLEINNNASKVTATRTAGVITLTANTPGEVVTYSVTGSDVPGDLVVASVTAASGTVVEWKMHEILISNDSSNGVFRQNITFSRYNGETLVSTSTSNSLHSVTIPQLLTNALA